MKTDLNNLQSRICDSIQAVQNDKKAQGIFLATKKGMPIADQANQAQILHSFSKIMDSSLAQDFIKTSNFGPYVAEFWPVVTAWYPNFPLKDLISVQSMKEPLGYLFFSSLKAANTKSPTAQGDLVETPLGMRKIRGNYPTGEIIGEEITADQFENKVTVLSHYPLNIADDYLGNFLIKVFSGNTLSDTWTVLSVNGDDIYFKDSNDANVATLNISAGSFTLASAPASGTKFSVNYVWNIEFADQETIPQVIEDIEMVPTLAKPRALKLQWTIFSEYVRNKQFGQDMREDNTKRILDLLYQYQCRYILDQMYDQSTVTANTVNIAFPSTYSADVVAQKTLMQLKQIATTIEINSGRMEGNRIVCGRAFKNFLEALPGQWFTPTNIDEEAFSGPREIGKFSTFTVYFDPFRGDNECFMTYRGTQWYDASYYLSEFMPIVPTDIVVLDVKVNQAFCAMEAYKFHKKNCVVKFNVNVTY